MKIRRSRRSFPLLVILSLLLGCRLQAQFHGAVAYITSHGPSGTYKAHTGEVITCQVSLLSLDDFGDHLVITNVFLKVNHGSGQVTTTNLLVKPVSLAPYEEVTVTTTYIVASDDPEWIMSTAFFGGHDLRDVAGGVPDNFLFAAQGLVKVLRPCFQFTNHCESVGDRILVTTSITNCGNSSFPFLVASNVTDISATRAFKGSAGTNPSFTFGVSATNARPSTLTVYATDELGWTISNSIFLDVPPMSRSVMAAAESGPVPVQLVSRALLTNLTMRLRVAAGYLKDVTLEPIVPQICESVITPLNNQGYTLSFSACSGQFLTGTQQVAWLKFTAASDQPTSIVRLVFDEIEGAMADGISVKNCSPQNSRVVVVGEEPLLELVDDGGTFPCFLYAPLTSTNRVEMTSALHEPAEWTILQRTVMPNRTESFVVQRTNEALYLRAVRE